MARLDFRRFSLAPRWRRPVGLGVSLLAHVLVLSFLAWPRPAPDLPLVDPEPIFLDIEPRYLLKNETPRPRVLLTPQQMHPAASGAQASALPFPLNRDDDTPPPRVISPEAAAAAQAQGVDPWRVRPETTDDRIAQALRGGAPGCAMLRGQMSTVERARCEQRLAQGMENAPVIRGSGDRERDARFAQEGAQALAMYEYRRAPLAGQSGVVGPADCVGSNFGIGCAGAHQDPGFRQNNQEAFEDAMGDHGD